MPNSSLSKREQIAEDKKICQIAKELRTRNNKTEFIVLISKMSRAELEEARETLDKEIRLSDTAIKEGFEKDTRKEKSFLARYKTKTKNGLWNKSKAIRERFEK